MPPGVALGLQGSDAVGGGVPVLLVCGDISVLEQAGNLRASVSQDEASPQLFSFSALSAAGASWHTCVFGETGYMARQPPHPATLKLPCPSVPRPSAAP